MPGATRPDFKLQTASLYGTGDATVYSGTQGPAAYSPFLSAFSDVVTAAGIAQTPFADTISEVDAGDQVVFVIALVNDGTTAYDLKLRNSLPAGFIIPDAGPDIVVTDGTGASLDSSGDLFDPSGGLTITPAIPASDANSGTNVVLVTFTLQAASNVAVPAATIVDSVQIVSFAASEGGPNLASGNSGAIVATTPVQTAAIGVASVADQPAGTLAAGQSASFDVMVTMPEGTAQGVRISEAVSASNGATLSLVSAQVVSQGANLTVSGPLTAQADGSIALGTVHDEADGASDAGDQIVVRITVANTGSAAGTGTLVTTVSATDPNGTAQRWSSATSNSVPLARPNAPPSIAGASPAQSTTDNAPVLPFSTIALTDPDVGQTETLTIHVTDQTLGTLSGPFTMNSAGDAVLSGSIDTVQAAARALVFTPAAGATGTEHFTLSLGDGADSVVDAQTGVAISAAARPSALPHFDLSTQTVLTSTPSGSTTAAPVETYRGPFSGIDAQFLYEGAGPLAIVAQQDNLLVGSKADATAVQLQGGTNRIVVEQGSSFLVCGSAGAAIVLHADQPEVTWNTVAGFGAADDITLYGFAAGISTATWVANSGATGWTGATLRFDLDGNGTVDSSLTFAGLSAADESRIQLTPGYVAGNYYLSIRST